MYDSAQATKAPHPVEIPARTWEEGMQVLYCFEAQFTEIVPVGVVPEGLRLDVHFEGRVTEGRLAGARVRGIDYLRFRPDGVGVLDVREVLRLDGRHVDVQAQGYIPAVAGQEFPPFEVMLAPDFQWPDAASPLHGFAMVRTGVPEWQDLNSTLVAFEGSANPGTGQLRVEAWAFEPSGRLTFAGVEHHA
jgi:hypothetical protein